MSDLLLSVVVSTYNRARLLPGTLESLRDQELERDEYEVIVVDNNSTDGTERVVRSFTEKAPNFRYVFEGRQGASYGRNAGILAANARLIAFTDDDVLVPPNWLRTINNVFALHPEVACIGGRVLPDRVLAWPSWLTREHWGPLALLDYGDAPLYVNATRRLCLITANAAYRREVFDEIGLFAPHVQTVGREIATEDHEILLRLWRAGGQGLYWPDLYATTDTPDERLTRGYHRRWHRRHGRFSAIMHDEELEQTRLGRFLGVPAHIYRRASRNAIRWATSVLSGRRDEAFAQEVGLWFCLGFLQARWSEYLRGSRRD